MTVKQTLLKFIYPVFRTFASLAGGTRGIRSNGAGTYPKQSFYSLQAVLADGTPFNFSALSHKKVLLVNLASHCGYTAQYSELQKLQDMHREGLVVLGFPANDFNGQEPGTDEEIVEFCQRNYRISFPLFRKHSVLKPSQIDLYKWLSHKELNGWNDQQPAWNFCKYLVDEEGKLLYYFPPAVSPLSPELIAAIGAPAIGEK